MSPAKVLIVDDNAATRRMVRAALARRGHEVLEASDARSAREIVAAQRPALVLLDLILPDGDGFELVGELRELGGADLSVLAFSGFISAFDSARISTVGFDDIIPKPVAATRLVPLVEAHLPGSVVTSERFGEGRRLIVADDDPLQLKLAAFKLGRLGFDVEIAPDGAAALDAIRRAPPDAVVSDVMMPNLDGFELALALRKDPHLHALPLVLVTSSYVEPSDRELARRVGAHGLVARSPELTELIAALRETLAKPPDAPALQADELPELERAHTQRVMRQLERQVMLNTGLAKRCSSLASELMVLTGISDAVLKHRDIDAALDEALASCFDAGGVAAGALFLVDERGGWRVRAVGEPALSAEDLRTFFGREAVLRTVLASDRPLHVPSAALDPEVSGDMLARCQARAALVVPLVSAAGPLGALLMCARGRELDEDDWRAFAIGVATQITQVLTLARAYAEREAAEQRAARQAALMKAVLDSAPDHIVHAGLDGTIHLANRELGGKLAAELIGTSLFDVLPNDQRAKFRAAFDRVLQTGTATGLEAQAGPNEGKAAWYEIRLGPVMHDGRVDAVVMAARDITEKKQAEMQLMLADSMASVGTLAAGVAHEINNPLASVIANLDMSIQGVDELGKTMTLPTTLSEELQDARSSADRVREIVRDLKIFSRAQEEHRGAVDVEKVLDSTVRMAWNELRHRARVVRDYQQVPRVDANESRLGQVFLNLLVNAVQAIPEGHYDKNQIRISTTFEGGRVVIKLADTGAGMSPEVQQRLFTPFFTTKPIGVGTGLGLAISHRIVTALGGTITFTSDIGKGTEFRVALPPADPSLPTVTQAIAIAKQRPKKRGRVLVIDDEETLAHALRRYLTQDHEVDAVTSARAALELLVGGKRYDVILCDVMMPQMTGMEVHGEIAKLDLAQAQRMVFLTGGAFTPTARAFLDAIPNVKLEKPFDLKALRHMVNELVV